MEGIKWLKQHNADCGAVKSWSEQPMTIAYSHTEWRDRAGRKLRRGAVGDLWLSIRCNSTDCPATVLVREDVLLAALAGKE